MRFSYLYTDDEFNLKRDLKNLNLLMMSINWSGGWVSPPGRKLSYIPILLLVQYINLGICSKSPKTLDALKTCPGFQDNRNITSNDILLTIPGNLTNTDETIDFPIDKKPHTLKCKNAFLKNVSWEDGENFQIYKSSIRGKRLKYGGKLSSHFTHDGYFHDEGNYYKPEEFCLQSISDYELQLQLCPINCSDSDKICIPKCCGRDEILVYWNFTCKKVAPNEPKWEPQLHYDYYPHKVIKDKRKLTQVRMQRSSVTCDYFDSWPLSTALRPKKPTPNKSDHFDIPWKILESKRPIFYNAHRKWRHVPEGEYCVDGYANWGREGNGTYSGKHAKHSVMLLCITGNDTAIETHFNAERAWTYSMVLLMSSVFPLLTAIIHLLLIDTQHLHGLTVLCHAVSMFLFYIFLAIAHLISLFPSIKGEPREGFCLAVAILAHYFCMTTFTWLSVMNCDLWLTFRSMRPVSRLSKQMRRFRLYFCIGWGLPAVLSSTFYGVDVAYRGVTDEVVVPDYADKNCFVATHARVEYLYSIIAIALAINTILVLWTFYIFYEFRKQNANTFKTKRSQSDKYSVRLFTKLFCVTGVAWLIELLSWKYNGEEKPWFVVVLDCFMFFQAFAIFYIFCINRRTLKKLEEKYPCLRSIIGPIRRTRWFMSPSDGDGVEMTTPGSTPRKLSLSVTANTKNSTLPRKASNSSVRSLSISSNKMFQTNKMETIPLDSDSESGVGTMESLNSIVDRTPAPDLIINT